MFKQYLVAPIDRLIFITLLLILVFPCSLFSYPIDGFEKTGIKRLDYYRLVNSGEIGGKVLPKGAKLSLSQVDIRLSKYDLSNRLPNPTESISKKLKMLLGSNSSSYSVAIIDLSNPSNPIYAEHNGAFVNNIGSVGKFLVAISLFHMLHDIYPESIEAREQILKTTIVTADSFSQPDHHRVKFWNLENKSLNIDKIQIGTEENLWSYLDWMLSPSSNGAAAMIQRELVLLSHFRELYPVSQNKIDEFFKQKSKAELSAIFLNAMSDPLHELDIDIKFLLQGSFFTRTGKKIIPGTRSVGNTKELVKLLYLLEQGKLIDSFSSIEIKRLLYNTEKRIRYASHPSLSDSAVYYKNRITL